MPLHLVCTLCALQPHITPMSITSMSSKARRAPADVRVRGRAARKARRAPADARVRGRARLVFTFDYVHTDNASNTAL